MIMIIILNYSYGFHMAPVLSNDDHRFITHILQIPNLSVAEELSCADAWKREADVIARNRLVNAHLKMVIKPAQKFARPGLPFMDLFNEGATGIISATNRFEPIFGFKFSSYAEAWIRSAISSYVTNNRSIVVPGQSRRQKAIYSYIKALRAKANSTENRLGHTQLQVVADNFGKTPAYIAMLEQHLNGDHSLNHPTSEIEDRGEHQDFLADPTPDQAESLIDQEEQKIRQDWLQAGMEMAGLTEREKDMFCRRQLLATPESLAELANKYNVSAQRAGQIQDRAFAKVQTAVCQTAGVAVVETLPPRSNLRRGALVKAQS